MLGVALGRGGLSGEEVGRRLTQVGPALAVDVEGHVAVQGLVVAVVEDQTVGTESRRHRSVLALVVAVALTLVREVSVAVGALGMAWKPMMTTPKVTGRACR